MKIFVLGATGYIGGTVAATLQALGHEVSGTARTPEKLALLEARGIAATHATLDDRGTLKQLAARADAVISAASADHRDSVEALVDALAGSGKRLIHTSGSSIVATDARGALRAEIYDEAHRPQPIDEKRARVAIDALVVSAVERKVHASVICPTLIYGRGLGLHTESVQVPTLVAHARKTGTARYIGDGENVWSNVHIRDLADLYVRVLERGQAGSFYFAENGEAAMRDVVHAVGRRYGLPVASLSPEEGADVWGFEMGRLGLASNSRVRAQTARALGWEPRGPSLLATIAHEPSDSP